jgi:lipoate-protein ligase A
MLNLLRLKEVPILSQLRIEEALLRADTGNWCLLNEGSPPAIVMGISAKPELVLNQSLLNAQPIPLIRRFSGGGTVVVNADTLFVTLIFNSADLDVAPSPEKIMKWTTQQYQQVFKEAPFALRENDYVLGERKCGGNAQYLCKGRWLHHTSFLWDYDPSLMDYLAMPPKMPQYRQQRTHDQFVCRIKDFFSDRELIFERLLAVMNECFQIREWRLQDVEQILQLPHRQATTLIESPKKHCLAV